MAGTAEALISVIVPVYKVEKYLKTCVNSIIGQTYKNLEIILVDDGSPDCCPQICDDFIGLDSRIKVIHKKNGGLSSARNAGIKIARGEYLIFVDSDDYISKDMIQILYDICHKYHVLLSMCSFIREGQFEEIVDYDIKASVLSKEQCFLNLCGPCGMTFCVSWGKLYHKSLFEYISFPYGKIHEDVYTTHLFFEKAGKIGNTSRRLYYYRKREGSLVDKERKKTDLKEINSFLYRCIYFKKKGYDLAYKKHICFCVDMIKKQYNKRHSLWSKNQRQYMKRKYRELLRDFVKVGGGTVSVGDWFFAGTPDLYYMISRCRQKLKR